MQNPKVDRAARPEKYSAANSNEHGGEKQLERAPEVVPAVIGGNTGHKYKQHLKPEKPIGHGFRVENASDKAVEARSLKKAESAYVVRKMVQHHGDNGQSAQRVHKRDAVSEPGDLVRAL